MAENTEKKIQINVNIADNFAAAKKGLDAAKKAFDDTQKTVALLTAKLNELKSVNAAQSIQQTAQAQTLLNTATQSATQSLGLLQQSLTQVQSIPLSNLSADQMLQSATAIEGLSAQVVTLQTQLQSLNLSNIEVGLQAVASATGQASASFQSLGSTFDTICTVIQTLDSAISIMNAAVGAQTVTTEVQTVAITQNTGAKQANALITEGISASTNLATAAAAESTTATQAETTATVQVTTAKVTATGATTGLTVAQRILNTVMKASPIFLIIAAIAALAVGIGKLISMFSAEARAAEAATKAQEKYDAAKAKASSTIEQINSKEKNAIEEINNAYRQKVLNAKQNGATEEQLAQLELERIKKVAAEQINQSKARTAAKYSEMTALGDSIRAQEKLVSEQTKNELENYQDKLDMANKFIGSEEDKAKYIQKAKEEMEEALSEEKTKLDNLLASRNLLTDSLKQEINLRNGVAISIKEATQDGSDQEAKDLAARNKAFRDKKLQEGLKQMDSDEQLALKDMELKKNFDEEDFDARQVHERKVFEEKQAWAKKKLARQLQDNKEFKAENDRQQKQLDADQKLFDKNEKAEKNKHDEDQKKAAEDQAKDQQQRLEDAQKDLMKMLGQETQLRIKEAQDASKKVADVFKQSNEELVKSKKVTVAEDGTVSGSEEDVKRYKENAASIAAITTKLQKDIATIEKEGAEQRVIDLNKLTDKKYAEDLKKYIENEQKKLEEERKIIQERIDLKKKEAEATGGVADTGQDAALAANQKRTNLLIHQNELLEKLKADDLSYKARIDLLKQFRDNQVAIYGEGSEQVKAVDAEITASKKSHLDQQIADVQEYAGHAKEAMSGLNELMGAMEEAQLQKATEKNETEKADLQAKLDANLISKEEYDAQVAASDAALEKKKAEIARKQAIREKAMAIFDIGVNTALSIMGSSKLGFPAAIPFVALSAAMGALQMAAVIAKPIPKAARGSLIGGRSHAAGGTLIEAEYGEAIVNKRSVGLFPELLSLINEAGGGIPFTTAHADGGFATREYRRQNGGDTITPNAIASAVKDAVQEVKIYTAIEDINKEGRKYTEISNSKVL